MISRILTNRKFGAFATAETPSPHSVWRLPLIRATDAGEEEAQVMAKVSGNDLVANALKDEGVEKAFYLTGGPMVDVAVRCIERFRTIDFRHEQAAAMAAHAYSRVSGKPGLCFAASGPGATNLITGVGNAFLDAVPVVA